MGYFGVKGKQLVCKRRVGSLKVQRVLYAEILDGKW